MAPYQQLKLVLSPHPEWHIKTSHDNLTMESAAEATGVYMYPTMTRRLHDSMLQRQGAMLLMY